MRKKKTKKEVTLQIPISDITAKALEEASERTGLTQAFLASWAIKISVNEPVEVGKWMGECMKHAIKHEAQETLAPMKELRVKTKVEEHVYEKLTQAAAVFCHTPPKMAGVLIGVVLPNTKLLQRALGTDVVAAIRLFFKGRDDAYFKAIMSEEETIESEAE